MDPAADQIIRMSQQEVDQSRSVRIPRNQVKVILLLKIQIHQVIKTRKNRVKVVLLIQIHLKPAKPQLRV